MSEAVAPFDPASPDRLEVAIDVSAIHEQSGGVLRYVTELVRHLPDCGVDPVLIDQRHRALSGAPGRFGSHIGTRFVAAAPTGRVARLAWEQVALERTARRADVRLLHSPHYTMPRHRPWSGSGGLRRPGSARENAHVQNPLAHVVTIHDLTFFSLPELHSPSKRRLFSSAIRYAAAHADALICVSDRTARQLQHFVDVHAPVIVAPHGIDLERFRPAGPDTADADAEALARHGIQGPYVLWLGAIAPHKNLGNVLRAFARLDRPDLSLVIGGSSWPGAWESVQQLAPPRAKRLGFVPDADVPSLLRHAEVFVYPSFEEGFGMPVLEALACGTAVVTSDDSVMADVAGTEAITVDPHNVESLLSGLQQALNSRCGPDSGASRDARVERAGRFTWGLSAQRHQDAYRVALERVS